MTRRISAEQVLLSVLDSDEEDEWSDEGPMEPGSDEEFYLDSE